MFGSKKEEVLPDKSPLNKAKSVELKQIKPTLKQEPVENKILFVHDSIKEVEDDDYSHSSFISTSERKARDKS